jgi:mRNA-degrading endonuclease RelE of RelBE toxin-antitoxin system
MRYVVEFSRSASKQFGKMERREQDAIGAALRRLAGELEAGGTLTSVRKLTGVEDEWRLRVGDYRVIFTLEVRPVDPPAAAEARVGDHEVEHRELGVALVVKVAHRREVYQDR